MTVTVQLTIENAKALQRVLEEQTDRLNKIKQDLERRLDDIKEPGSIQKWLEDEIFEIEEELRAIHEYLVGIEDQVENL